jgi:hypothetical protein
MYILDKEGNQLITAEPTTFKEQKLKERQHLQEWIAKSPEVLGEPLLIIQKEFDGFDQTNERLDLLALDKTGRLVVIENKLDDSGKNVTWQAIKYASYCSSLSLEEIIEIYANYLMKSKEEAKEMLLSFFEREELDDVEINPENTQRMIFVAANFRKEVTSSVLWLRNFGIDINCIKVSPFMYNGKLMVEFDQIIPIKEAEEYTIKMAEKKKVDSQNAESKKRKENDRSKFWTKFIEYNQKVNGKYASSSGTTDPWLGKGGLNLSGVSVNIVIGRQACRTEIYINTGSKDENKRIYDFIYNHKDQLESKLGELCWERLDDKVVCRISKRKDFSFLSEDEQPKIFEFFVKSTDQFIDNFAPLTKQYKND